MLASNQARPIRWHRRCHFLAVSPAEGHDRAFVSITTSTSAVMRASSASESSSSSAAMAVRRVWILPATRVTALRTAQLVRMMTPLSTTDYVERGVMRIPSVGSAAHLMDSAHVYSTVRVPTMPASAWPGTSQINVYVPAGALTTTSWV